MPCDFYGYLRTHDELLDREDFVDLLHRDAFRVRTCHVYVVISDLTQTLFHWHQRTRNPHRRCVKPYSLCTSNSTPTHPRSTIMYIRTVYTSTYNQRVCLTYRIHLLHDSLSSHHNPYAAWGAGSHLRRVLGARSKSNLPIACVHTRVSQTDATRGIVGPQVSALSQP